MTATKNYRTEVVVADSKWIETDETNVQDLLRIKAEAASVCIIDGPKYLDGVPKKMTILAVTDVENKGTNEYYELSGFRGMVWITDYHVVVYARSAERIEPDGDMRSKLEQFISGAFMEE